MDNLFGLVFWLVFLVFLLALFAGMWKMYAKAGQPGWAALIPIYNVVVLLKIVGRPLWWILLFCIPFVNLIIAFVIAVDLAKAFGRSTLFGIVVLGLLTAIGYMMLGFGNSQYTGSTASQTSSPATNNLPPQPATPVAPPPATPQV